MAPYSRAHLLEMRLGSKLMLACLLGVAGVCQAVPRTSSRTSAASAGHVRLPATGRIARNLHVGAKGSNNPVDRRSALAGIATAISGAALSNRRAIADDDDFSDFGNAADIYNAATQQSPTTKKEKPAPKKSSSAPVRDSSSSSSSSGGGLSVPLPAIGGAVAAIGGAAALATRGVPQAPKMQNIVQIKKEALFDALESKATKKELFEAIEDLEGVNPSPKPVAAMDGFWKVIYTTESDIGKSASQTVQKVDMRGKTVDQVYTLGPKSSLDIKAPLEVIADDTIEYIFKEYILSTGSGSFNLPIRPFPLRARAKAETTFIDKELRVDRLTPGNDLIIYEKTSSQSVPASDAKGTLDQPSQTMKKTLASMAIGTKQLKAKPVVQTQRKVVPQTKKMAPPPQKKPAEMTKKKVAPPPPQPAAAPAKKSPAQAPAAKKPAPSAATPAAPKAAGKNIFSGFFQKAPSPPAQAAAAAPKKSAPEATPKKPVAPPAKAAAPKPTPEPVPPPPKAAAPKPKPAAAKPGKDVAPAPAKKEAPAPSPAAPAAAAGEKKGNFFAGLFGGSPAAKAPAKEQPEKAPAAAAPKPQAKPVAAKKAPEAPKAAETASTPAPPKEAASKATPPPTAEVITPTAAPTMRPTRPPTPVKPQDMFNVPPPPTKKKSYGEYSRGSSWLDPSTYAGESTAPAPAKKAAAPKPKPKPVAPKKAPVAGRLTPLKKGATPPPVKTAAASSTTDDRVSAEQWISNWKSSVEGGSGAAAPDAQAWIKDWKKSTSAKKAAPDAQTWINDWKKSVGKK